MKLLLATILSVCSAAAVPAPDDPTQFYVANCVLLRVNQFGVTIRVPNYFATGRSCDTIGGRSCLTGCVLSGLRSDESATREGFRNTCTDRNADIEAIRQQATVESLATC